MKKQMFFLEEQEDILYEHSSFSSVMDFSDSLSYAEEVPERKKQAKEEEMKCSQSFASEKDKKFLRMLNMDGLNIAEPYLGEEAEHLLQVLKSLQDVEDYSFVSVGAGPFLQFRVAIEYVKRYIALDPRTPHFPIDSKEEEILSLYKEKTRVVPKRFEEILLSDISEKRNIFFFAFNVFSYIQNPLHHLNRVLREEDIVIVSLWTMSKRANVVSDFYFKHVNQKKIEKIVVPSPKQSDWKNLEKVRSICEKKGHVNKLIVLKT